MITRSCTACLYPGTVAGCPSPPCRLPPTCPACTGSQRRATLATAAAAAAAPIPAPHTPPPLHTYTAAAAGLCQAAVRVALTMQRRASHPALQASGWAVHIHASRVWPRDRCRVWRGGRVPDRQAHRRADILQLEEVSTRPNINIGRPLCALTVLWPAHTAARVCPLRRLCCCLCGSAAAVCPSPTHRRGHDSHTGPCVCRRPWFCA